MRQPFLSIIMPLYNKEESIITTINAILSQSFSDFELLIVNDGSTDSSVERAGTIHDSRIRIVSKPNGGPSSARNVGIQEAKGLYGYFIDADDRLLPGALQIIYNTILKYPQYNAYTFNFYIKEEQRRYLYSKSYCNGKVRLPFFKWLVKDFHPGAGRYVFRLNKLGSYRFREDLRRWEDSEYYFNIIRDYRFFSSAFPIFEYNQETLGASKPRKNYKEDFCCCLDPKGKSFWEQVCLYQRYLEAKQMYPEIISHIYGDAFNKLRYRIAYSIAMRYLSFKLWYNDNK